MQMRASINAIAKHHITGQNNTSKLADTPSSDLQGQETIVDASKAAAPWLLNLAFPSAGYNTPGPLLRLPRRSMVLGISSSIP